MVSGTGAHAYKRFPSSPKASTSSNGQRISIIDSQESSDHANKIRGQ